jgi:hypothetical protein
MSAFTETSTQIRGEVIVHIKTGNRETIVSVEPRSERNDGRVNLYVAHDRGFRTDIKLVSSLSRTSARGLAKSIEIAIAKLEGDEARERLGAA